MIFGNRRVVEEELERIRLANLPPKREEAEAAEELDEDVIECEVLSDDKTAVIETSMESVESVEIGFTAKDVLAMIIAAFSIILPYALVILGITVLFVMFFFRG